MKIEDVKKLSPVERFIYWIRERHTIHLKRRAGVEKPWTDDKVLQQNFFTNPYRENDKVTVWFRERVREPLRNNPDVIMATIIFRWFNAIPTGEALIEMLDGYQFGRLQSWNSRHVVRYFDNWRKKGKQIFTGAFMINSPPGKPKLEAIVDRIDAVWKDRKNLIDALEPEARSVSMKEAHSLLTKYDGLGGFMAYEIVCDLRHTYVLENATDKETWSNPGPGAVRGLCRILGRDFPKGNNSSSPPVPKDWTERTQELLRLVQRRLPKMPHFEMREIEHSLCEADKYERVLWGDGRAKRKYNGNM